MVEFASYPRCALAIGAESAAALAIRDLIASVSDLFFAPLVVRWKISGVFWFGLVWIVMVGADLGLKADFNGAIDA